MTVTAVSVLACHVEIVREMVAYTDVWCEVNANLELFNDNPFSPLKLWPLLLNPVTN